MKFTEETRTLIRRQLDRPLPPELDSFAESLRQRYGESVLAILYYGSCLRRGQHQEGLNDFIVVVDNYRRAYGTLLPALGNAMLPPNVFYLETQSESVRLRAKYAVVSLAQLQRLARPERLQPYFWARLAQPVALLMARDDSRIAVEAVLLDAQRAFITNVLPALPAVFQPLQVFTQGLQLTYATEFRSERSAAVEQRVLAEQDFYEQIVTSLLQNSGEFGGCRWQRQADGAYHLDASRLHRTGSRLLWALRRPYGKTLAALRLIKAALTFQGGLDYILWKIERHSGVRLEPSAAQRRHPLLLSWGLLWQIYRRGGFK
ncbi:MAG: hypothetical protein CVV13_01710 [Gammaproteobacteria bacterium HGW-Gammaproteobacteria-3]|nr:MAG: hypothetical protein CVV13_01710 [Gammaproteobacteria bacterium HGW-Gammaproteobacteria-3]